MINVVIIEKDIMVNMLLEKIVTDNKKFNVLKTFLNLNDSFEYLQDNPVDLLIVEIPLNNENDFNLLKKIRKHEIFTEKIIDIIIISSSNNSLDIEKAIKLRTIDYLIKPFNFSRLKLSLDKYIQKRKITEITKDSLDQNQIDKIYNSFFKFNKELPKGINEKTLDKINALIFDDLEREWCLKEVSKQAKVSSVTVKKYLDYLENAGKLKSYLSYGSVGRPEMKYKYN